MSQFLITFPSVYHAFRARKILTEKKIPVELITIPRELSAACEGLAACLDEEYVVQAVEILKEKEVVMLHTGIEYTIDK